MITLAPADLALILGYLVFLAFVIWRTRDQVHAGEADFLLLGRTMTLPAFVATLVSTWYGGILGVGEYSFLYGISNWLVFGVPYYLAALLFALFLASPARRSRVLSIPDQLERAYGRGPALLGAGVVFLMTVPAAYVLMLGVLLRMFFGGPLVLWILAGAAASGLYVGIGGFRSVVRTDVLQFILMYLGFALLLAVAAGRYGGFAFLHESLPPAHLSWSGGRSLGAIAVWYVIALSTLVEPSFYQRCYAARSTSVARGGILVSILFWIVFDALTTFTGLYARAVLGPGTDPLTSYPALAERVLPVGLKGLFFVGLLAVIMSTVDSYSFLAAQSLGRDIISRARGEVGTWRLRRFQWSLAASSLLAVLLAAWKGSVVGLWHDLGSLGTPMLLFPLAAGFRRPPLVPRRFVLPSMAVSGLTALLWLLAGEPDGAYPFGLEPIYPGLAVSALILSAGALLRRRTGAS